MSGRIVRVASRCALYRRHSGIGSRLPFVAKWIGELKVRRHSKRWLFDSLRSSLQVSAETRCDAMGLTHGGSRLLLRKCLTEFAGCRGLDPWRLTLMASHETNERETP